MPANSHAPGAYFAEAVGTPSTITPISLDIFGLSGLARRGYVDRAVLCQSPGDFDREFGGVFGANHLPLAVKGFFAQAGGGAQQSNGGLLIARNEGEGAKRGSARVLDCSRYTTGFIYQVSPGAYGKDVSYTTERAFSFTKASTGTPDGVLDSAAEEIGVEDPSQFMPGDVFFAVDDDGNYATGVVFSVDPSGAITFASVTPVGGDVASGARISTSSEHLVRTTLASGAASADTQVSLSATDRVRVGQWLTFLGDDVDTDPVTRVVESISGLTVKLTAALGIDMVSGGKVVSCEFGLAVKEFGRVMEARRLLSMSETFTERYVQELLGDGATYTLSGSRIATSDVANTNLTNNLASLVLDSISGVVKGLSYKVVATDGSPTLGEATAATGVILQVKDIDSVTKTLFFDNVGLLGGNIGTGGVDIWLATPTYAANDSNESRFIIFDQYGAKGGDASANPGALHFTIPMPVVDIAITGGEDGTVPTTIDSILGDDTDGSETSVYLFPKSDFFGVMLEFGVPGFANSITATPKRQDLDQALDVLARSWDVVYSSHTTSDLTSPIAAVVWRNDQLGIDSSWSHMSFDWFKIQDPAASTNVVLITPRVGWDMGVAAFRRATFGAHWPPANVPYIGGVKLRVKLRPDQHALLNNNGLNAAIDLRADGVRGRGARTLYSSVDDGTKRWFLNVRYWLQTMKRSIDASMVDIPFLPGSRSVWPRISRPVQGLMEDQFKLGAFEPASQSDAFEVQIDDETTTVSDFQTGDANVRLAVVPVGAWERVNFTIESVQGSVRTTEVGGFRST